MIKRYKNQAISTDQQLLQMYVEDNTRKKLQMHAVARNLTACFAIKLPSEFEGVFIDGRVFYSEWGNCPVTKKKK